MNILKRNIDMIHEELLFYSRVLDHLVALEYHFEMH